MQMYVNGKRAGNGKAADSDSHEAGPWGAGRGGFLSGSNCAGVIKDWRSKGTGIVG